MAKYFLKDGDRVHKYPVPDECNVKYEGEKLYDEIPPSHDKCDRCFGLPR